MIDAARNAIYFAGFMGAMAVYVAAVKVGGRLGIVHADFLVSLSICILLTVVFPDSRGGLGWGRRGISWVAAASAMLCAVWTFAFWLWNEHSVSVAWDWNFPIYAIGMIVVTPWFEEKLLRHLLLSSIRDLIGVSASVLIVSLLFAWAHKGMFLWSLLGSLVLCWMRVRLDARTSHCVVVHGTVNAYVFGLYFL